MPPRRCRTIAVAGGKGGVGKTTVAVNLGMTLAMMGRDTMLLDADMGLANVDVLLGLAPSRHIGHMLDGLCTLQDLMLEAPHGLKVIPAGSGARRLAQLGSGEQAAVIRAFDELPQPPEFLLVDTAAGISDSVAMFAAAADDVVLVVCDEPASITDAYAHDQGAQPRFRGEAASAWWRTWCATWARRKVLHEKLARVTDRFLDVMLDFMGWVPHDERLRQAIRRQNAVVDACAGQPFGTGIQAIGQVRPIHGQNPIARVSTASHFSVVRLHRRRGGDMSVATEYLQLTTAKRRRTGEDSMRRWCGASPIT